MTSQGIIIATGSPYDNETVLKNLDSICFRCRNLAEGAMGASTIDGLYILGRCKSGLTISDKFTQPWHCKKFDINMERCKVNYL